MYYWENVHESCWICVWKKFSNTEVIFWQKGLSSSSQEQCEYLQKGGHGHPQKWQIMVMEALSLCLLALASWRETAHGKLYKKGDSKQWVKERGWDQCKAMTTMFLLHLLAVSMVSHSISKMLILVFFLFHRGSCNRFDKSERLRYKIWEEIWLFRWLDQCCQCRRKVRGEVFV